MKILKKLNMIVAKQAIIQSVNIYFVNVRQSVFSTVGHMEWC